jgi:hypothetical protein
MISEVINQHLIRKERQEVCIIEKENLGKEWKNSIILFVYLKLCSSSSLFLLLLLE